MVFSKMYAWEGDPAVMQVLVFACYEAKEVFDNLLPLQPQTVGGFPCENGIGVMYKLRAVKNEADRYIPVVRCGATGREILHLNHLPKKTPEDAIVVAITKLLETMTENVKHLVTNCLDGE